MSSAFGSASISGSWVCWYSATRTVEVGELDGAPDEVPVNVGRGVGRLAASSSYAS